MSIVVNFPYLLLSLMSVCMVILLPLLNEDYPPAYDEEHAREETHVPE